ncbi:PREDICTED: thyroid transcription factor 1-associated protein 26 homolog isoform X1 [Dinoponera quadriceps]|uniref:Thyroid transcription factor 1-associated protein 26 homolog isoform X1 n=1 Tax=Dinoponera quadriceps TaxID=609295 RepID=A0A6P3Y018_DINQU|nr:PREDICTED: thyroid transcription factor 1-associated protein 26 homolog isoform X1 [Dinoponera quadriceps]
MKRDTKNIENKDRRKKGGEEKKTEKRNEKTFDKKKYRLQKYSNKYKINQWEERRKKAILREFHKELKRNQQNSAQMSINSSDTSKNADETSSNSMKNSPLHKSVQEYKNRMEEEKRTRGQEEATRVKAKQEAAKKYKEKKIRAFKALSKKTKKGQPVMKGRIEMLLEKIQQDLT